MGQLWRTRTGNHLRPHEAHGKRDRHGAREDVSFHIFASRKRQTALAEFGVEVVLLLEYLDATELSQVQRNCARFATDSRRQLLGLCYKRPYCTCNVFNMDS